MALDLLRSAKSILKIDDLTIDNIVFKLHYRVTVAILIGSSLVGVAKQVIWNIFYDVQLVILMKYFPVLVFRRPNQLPDQLWSVQRRPGWLLLDPFHLPHQSWVPGQCGLCGRPRAHHRETGQVRGAGILHQLQQHPGILHTGHFILPVGSFHPHPPGIGTFCHTVSLDFPPPQAALFYIPRKIWKTCEGGLMASFGKISLISKV